MVTRVVLYVASLGAALYLLLPMLPGLGRSAEAAATASRPLLVAALAAELCSLLCYSELLARSVVAAARMRSSPERRRRAGLGPWFAFRLAVCGHGAGRVFPGGWALLAAIALGALRRRGFGAADVGLALDSFSLLVYGALGILCAAAFFSLAARHGVATIAAVAVCVLLVLLIAAVLAAHAPTGAAPTREVSRKRRSRGRSGSCSALASYGGRWPSGRDNSLRFARNSGWPARSCSGVRPG
jgi:hypothetical protein